MGIFKIDRRQLRIEVRQRRLALNRQQQARAAQSLLIKLARHPWFKNAQSVAFYLPNDGEISPTHLIQLAHQQGKTVYLPILHRRRQQMLFREYRRGDKLLANRYQIGEPLPKRKTVPICQIDLVLMPLVAFDRDGNRLGMGGGFYDRALAKAPHRQPKRIGLAHHLQKVPRLPVAPWDQPLHAVATDREFIVF